MKKISMIIAGLTLAVPAIFAQTQPAPSPPAPNSDVRTQTPNSTNPTGVYQTTPMPAQTSPVKDGDGNSSTAPGGVKQSNPFGRETPATGTESTVNQPYNDYHLTQPSTSPVNQARQNSDAPVSSDVQPSSVPADGMIRVESYQVPYPVRETLKSDIYSGWEKSNIFYDQNSNQYSIDIGSGSETQNYRFDQDGKVIQNSSDQQ